MDVEEKMRLHSDSIRNKRHSGYLKLVKKRTGNQPLMNMFGEMTSTAASQSSNNGENATDTTRSIQDNEDDAIPEGLLDERKASVLGEGQNDELNMSMKIQRLKVEKQKLNDDYMKIKENYQIVQNAHGKIQEYNQELLKRCQNTEQNKSDLEKKISTLQQKMISFKDMYEKKDKECLQLKNDNKKLKSNNAYQTNMRRSTYFLEQQLKQRFSVQLSQQIQQSQAGNLQLNHGATVQSSSSSSSQTSENQIPSQPMTPTQNQTKRREGNNSTILQEKEQVSGIHDNSTFNPPKEQNQTFGSSFQNQIGFNSPHDHSARAIGANITSLGADVTGRHQTSHSLAFQMGKFGMDSDDDQRNSISRPPSAFNLVGSRPPSQFGGMGSAIGLLQNMKKLDFPLSQALESKPPTHRGLVDDTIQGLPTAPTERVKGQFGQYGVGGFPSLINRNYNQDDLKAYFFLNLLVCKSDYPDFDKYTAINPNQLYAKLQDQQIQPIDFLKWTKDQIRVAYRSGKLNYRNVDPINFIYRMWTLKDVCENKYIGELNLMESFFYPKRSSFLIGRETPECQGSKQESIQLTPFKSKLSFNGINLDKEQIDDKYMQQNSQENDGNNSTQMF